jgi:hypothetical protein
VLLPSGKVAFVPYSADKVGIFDPATDTFSLVGDTISTTSTTEIQFRGGVLLPSGKVAGRGGGYQRARGVGGGVGVGGRVLHALLVEG